MASQAQRNHVRGIRKDAAENPSKYTSRRILSSVDRSSGTTRQDITDRAIAARDAEAPQVEPGTMGGTQVVEPAHTGLSNPALSNHQLRSPVNPFIHTRPASDINVKTATIQESIEQAKDRRTPEYTPEEQRVRSQMVGGGSETLMYTPDQRADLMESISAKGRRTPEYTPEEQRVRSQMVGGGSETLMYTPDQRADLMESIHQKASKTIANKINEDQLSGATSNADISQFSMGVYNKASDISGTIKAGIPELKEHTGAAGAVLEYPVKSVAGLIEMGGMVPGGVEVLKENPGAIMPALSVGGYQSTYGIVKAFEENPLQVTSDFATVGLFGYGVGHGVGKVAKYGPNIKRANVVNIESGGGNPTIGPVNYGWSVNLLDRPVLTYVTGKGLSKGAGAAPAELLQGKTITAFSARETALFRETVTDVGGSIEGQYFGAGYEIAKGISKNKKPIVEPESFKVTSEHVPDSAKPIVEESIRNYSGDINVYGSVSQKMQMGDYMTRSPKDIEVVVDNPSQFVSVLEKGFEGTGIKYKVKGSDSGMPKVEFMTDQGAVKGIEIFGKDSPPETIGGYKQGSDIAYGFQSQKNINIDKVSMMRLSEQGPRKFAGGNVLKDGKIEPVHPGRMKDVGDLIDIGTAFEIEKGIGIESSLIKYSEIAKQKGASSSVMDFIVENKRVPKKSEFTNMLRDPADVIKIDTPDLLYSSSKSPSPSRSSSLRSSLPSSVIVNKRSSPPSSIMSELDSSLSVISSIKGPSQPPSSIFEASIRDMVSPSPSRSSSSRSSPSPSPSPPSSHRAVTPMVDIPSMKLNGFPQVSNPRSKSKSKRSQDPLDLLDKNLYNKYNDPLKVGASINADVKKLLRGGF